MEACVPAIQKHLRKYGGALVLPLTPETIGPNLLSAPPQGHSETPMPPAKCKTHVASPDDLAFASGFRPTNVEDQRFTISTWHSPASTHRLSDACRAGSAGAHSSPASHPLAPQ